MNKEYIEEAIYERTREFVPQCVYEAILELIALEREACAKLAENSKAPFTATAIRARGETK